MADFTEKEIQEVWEKGKIVSGNNPNKWRKDSCDAWINREMYGEPLTDLSYAWEIDHINPDGGDGIDNLQPLQWENNRNKSDNYPNWECKITSRSTKNIYKGN